MHENLQTVYDSLSTNPTHDDLLFVTQVYVGTNCLMRLTELTWPDKLDLRDYQKVSMRHSVQFLTNALSFWLPGHKADKVFKGNQLIVHQSAMPNACSLFHSYLVSHDARFLIRPELWIRANGTILTRAWFIARLRWVFASSIAGQSMWAGGATALAEAGTLPNLIQTAGRWTIDTFNRYVQKNPFLFEALLLG